MNESEVSGAQPDRRSLVKRVLPLVVLAGVAALVISQGWHEYLTLQQIAANRDLLKGYIAGNYHPPDRLAGLREILFYPAHIQQKLADYTVIPAGYFQFDHHEISIFINGENINKPASHRKFNARYSFVLI